MSPEATRAKAPAQPSRDRSTHGAPGHRCSAACGPTARTLGGVDEGGGATARSTRQRGAVQACLEATGRPLTPHELLDLARTEVPGLGIATVYRHLRQGLLDGRLRSVDLPGQPSRYEWVVHAHQHHFHCEACDRVYPVAGCVGAVDALAPPGFTVARHDLTLHGRCADCTDRAGAPDRPLPAGEPGVAL
jgi:Fur family ferric uptake transcriptional regulator